VRAAFLTAAGLALSLLGADPARPAAAAAGPAVAGEYEVKAAFLYNFARFVEWPPQAIPSGRPLVIAVLGQDPFGSTLDAVLQGRTIRDHPLAVRRVARVEEADGAHVLFISRSEGDDVARILRRLEGSPVLTVGEEADFARQGGVVRFRVDEDRVGFEINVDSAERAGLKMSSQLLKLARIVRAPGRS
jgi:hypothetical protein